MNVALDAGRVSLSLVSHTNAGKTTLARTLLGRDVGEVRDEAHVTDAAQAFTLVDTPEGDALTLWDTPGFGDSHRLARRLEQSGNPIGWMLGQVWDRFRDRPFWFSPPAVRNVREQADLVLYLVNASEDPADAAYVAPEMRILDWIGKPVIALLNQTGAPRAPAEEAAEIDRWRAHLSGCASVRAVMALDAFARCWVQEVALLRAVAEALPPRQQPAMERLVAAWRRQRREAFDASMQVLAGRIARAALDRETIAAAGVRDALRDVGAALGVGRDKDPEKGPRGAAMRALAERLEADVRSGTDRLIALHGLDGHASQVVLARLAEHYAVTQRVGEGKAAILGGLVTGSLLGLKADLATGGLTLGGGLIAGGILGAIGAAGLAKGYNLVRGADSDSVTWADAVLDDLVVSALLGYLAVAHYGRGRGEWSASEHPPHWEDFVRAAIASRHAPIRSVLARRHDRPPEQALGAALAPELSAVALKVLGRLYPDQDVGR